MGAKVAWLLAGSYGGIVIALVGGTLVMPELFWGFPHRGISFWGNYFPAVVPYTIGLLVSTLCLAMAAYLLPDYPEQLGILRRLLGSLAVGLGVVLLTPEQASALFYWAHTLAAVYLFVVAGFGAVWIMQHAGKSTLDWFLFWLLVAGVLLSLLSASYIRMLGVLGLGQVLAINGAALLFFRAVVRWSAQEVKE